MLRRLDFLGKTDKFGRESEIFVIFFYENIGEVERRKKKKWR